MSLRKSRFREIYLGLALSCGALPGWAQTRAEAVLTLDQAVALGLEDNRLVKNAGLEEARQQDVVAETKTQRYPAFSVNVLEGHLLQDVSLVFPPGFLGDLPIVGPIPRQSKSLTTPAQWTTFAFGGVDQPITQLYRINLGVKAQQLGKDIAHQQLRLQRQTTADDVKRSYYGLIQTQNALAAIADEIKFYRELDRVTDEYLKEQAVLEADSLDVKAKLAQAEYQATVLEDTLATQKESMNNLLARDPRTLFEVAGVPEIETYTLDADQARQRALEQRPEIRQARLKVEQAEYDRRITKSQYIPDLSATLRVISPYDVQLSPKNIGTAGFFFSWEPFDWGRKRHELGEKTKTLEEAKNGVEETTSQVLIDVDNRFRKLQEAQAYLKVSRLNVDVAKERLRVTNNKYGQNAALLSDVLKQEAQLADAHQQLEQAFSQYWTARADLEKAMGEE
ncbi:MAG TPA: TolC family protein [Terriglobales bacterium]|nr:TolC family protein [Terriglobales bacterium]